MRAPKNKLLLSMIKFAKFLLDPFGTHREVVSTRCGRDVMVAASVLQHRRFFLRLAPSRLALGINLLGLLSARLKLADEERSRKLVLSNLCQSPQCRRLR